MNQKELKRTNTTTTSNSHLRSVFHYHVHDQAGLPCSQSSKRKRLYIPGHFEVEFHFSVFTIVQGSVSIKAARKTNISLHLTIPKQPQDVQFLEI